MQRFRVIVLVLGTLSITFAADAQPASVDSDQAAIRAVVLRELDGWSRFDPVHEASCYTGYNVETPGKIHLASEFTTEPPWRIPLNLSERPGYCSAKETTPPHITDIHMLSPTGAAEWVEEKSAGRMNDGTGRPMALAAPITLKCRLTRMARGSSPTASSWTDIRVPEGKRGIVSAHPKREPHPAACSPAHAASPDVCLFAFT